MGSELDLLEKVIPLIHIGPDARVIEGSGRYLNLAPLRLSFPAASTIYRCMATVLKSQGITEKDMICGIDLFGPTLGLILGVGSLSLRKRNGGVSEAESRLPGGALQLSYYNGQQERTLSIRGIDNMEDRQRMFLVDDFLSTGSTLGRVIRLVKENLKTRDISVAGNVVMIERQGEKNPLQTGGMKVWSLFTLTPKGLIVTPETAALLSSPGLPVNMPGGWQGTETRHSPA